MKVPPWSTVLLLPFLAVPVRAVDITGCDQVVPSGEVGVLQNDVDCTGEEPNCLVPAVTACAKDPTCATVACGGIVLGDRATLQMNGHTVTNGMVSCPLKHCSIVGPGTLVGGYGIDGFGNLVVSDVDLHDAESGVFSIRGKVTAQNVTVSNVTNWGIAGSSLRLTNVSATNCFIGVYNGGGTLKGTGIVANDNSIGGIVSAKSARLSGVSATGNGFADEGKGGVAVISGSLRLENSVVTGNLVGGTRPVDLWTAHRPKLIATTCDRSEQFVEGSGGAPSWGVCAGD